MRRLALLIPVVAFAVGGSARADFAPPSHRSEPLAVTSANGRYNAVVSPPVYPREDEESGDQSARYEPPKVALYSGPKPGAAPLWTAELPEELHFTGALVSDDGRYVVVLDEQGWELAAALFGPKGQRLASWSLEAMLAEHEQVRLSRSTQRTFWSGGKHRLDSSADRLVLDVAYAGEDPFSRSGGKAVEIELSTAKVLNRSPELTAPAAELVKRLRTTTNSSELESLAVQLRRADDPAASGLLLAVVRDASVPARTRLAALGALCGVGTDEQFVTLASSLGTEPMLDLVVLRELQRRKLTTAIPHLERVKRDAKDKSLHAAVSETLEFLRRPPPPQERDLGELLKSDKPDELRVAFWRLKPDVLPSHVEQVLRLCAHADKQVRTGAEDVLLNYLNLNRPDPAARARLTSITSSQTALAAMAPVVLIALARLAADGGDADEAIRLLGIAQRATGVAREQGAATAAARLASLHLANGRTKEALRSASLLEGMKDLPGCAPHDREFRLSSGNGARCRGVPASTLADGIRANANPPVRLEAKMTLEADVGLVLTTSLVNISKGALYDLTARAANFSYTSDDGTQCAPMVRPFAKRRSKYEGLYGVKKQIAPKQRLQTEVSIPGCGGPKATLRFEQQLEVTAKDANGREWRQIVPVAATTRNP